MFERGLDNASHMIVRKGVKYILPGFTVSNKVTLTKGFQLMRDRRLRHAEELCDIAYAHRLAVDRKKNTDPRAVAENLEQVRQIVKNGFFWHMPSLLFHDIGVYFFALAKKIAFPDFRDDFMFHDFSPFFD